MTGEQDGREDHGRDHRHRVGFEEVGGHAGAVTDVVTDVVGDRSRVARIVFRDARFHLADEVAADVRTLGEDAAAQTRKDRNERSTEAERHKRVDDFPAGRSLAQHFRQHVVVDRNAEQREAGDQHAGDGTRLEGDIEAAAKRLGGRLSGAHVGANRDVHADVTGETREHGADGEADGLQRPEQQPCKREDRDADVGNGLVLTVKVRLRTFTDGAGDFLHARVTRVCAHNRLCGDERVDDGQKSARDDPQKYVAHFEVLFGPGFFGIVRAA